MHCKIIDWSEILYNKIHFYNLLNEVLGVNFAVLIRMRINPFMTFLCSKINIIVPLCLPHTTHFIFQWIQNVFFFQPHPANSKISFVHKVLIHILFTFSSGTSSFGRLANPRLTHSFGMQKHVDTSWTWERLHFLVEQGF